MKRRLAIIGGGPAALLVYKRLVESASQAFTVDIFEATDTLGSGMPYSPQGAGKEHVTNVSSDELPDLIEPLADWVKNQPQETLEPFGLARQEVHEKKVMPRLLFGQYLSAQFHSLLQRADGVKLETKVHFQTVILDISVNRSDDKVITVTHDGRSFAYDFVVICSGHHWPDEREGKIPGYFDSPYPPAKISARFNHTVVVRGSSLTAVDAIRTLARNNGRFVCVDNVRKFEIDAESPDFRVVMHSRHGLLPCVRVHMEEPHVADKPLISPEEIEQNIKANNGFLELDFLFEKGFKKPLQESDPSFYAQIKDMNMESFVDAMMAYREAREPFHLFKEEYLEAKKSIRQEKPVYWKEMLSALSFAMNYPAKYFSAEDMLRLQKNLMPLISVVIAFVPQSSCEELMALHQAGRLDLIADGESGGEVAIENEKILYRFKDCDDTEKETLCTTFIDCTGQKHLSLESFPFKSLVKEGIVSHARLKFRSMDEAKRLLAAGEKHIEQINGEFYLRVSGADITDNFQVVSTQNEVSKQIYLMAVPYMGGFNPDYSGLDFCERASQLIVDSIISANGYC